MLFSFEDLLTNFGSDAIDNGVFYLDSGRLGAPDVRRNGELITALIHDFGKRSLRIYIQVEAGVEKGLVFHGECSCSKRHNCEHVVAVLLRALADEQELQPEVLGDVLQSSPPPAARTETYPSSVHQRLLYLLFPDPVDGGAGTYLDTVSARSLKDGVVGEFRGYAPGWAARGLTPRFVLTVDLELLGELNRLPVEAETSSQRLLQGREAGKLFKRILETGRCYLREAEIRLYLASSRRAELEWAMDGQGRQSLSYRQDPAVILFHLYEPWYVDVETGASGMVETGLPVALFEELCRLPMILPEHVEELQAELARCYPKVELPVLRRLEVVEPPFVRPVPCLRFRTRLVDIQGDRDTVLSASVDEVQLTFDYAGLCLGSQQPAEFVRAGKLIRIARDRDLEEECIQQLLEAGLETGDFPQPEDDMESYCLRGGAGEWLDFQLKTLPWLREQGWRIEFDGGFRYRLAEAGQWYGELEPSTGDDWFSVSLGVDVEGERINLLPILMELIQDLQDDFRPDQQPALDSPRQFIVPLGDGRLVPLPAARVRHIAATMFELYRPGALDGDNRLRLNRFQIARLLELGETPAQSSIKWLGGNEIRGLAARLQRYNEIPTVAPPSGLTTRLREYQLRGLAWLQFFQEQELGGILADDMGLGKTVQALANLLLDKEQGRADRPSLVVAPTSLMVNWRREAQQFTSKLRVLTLHGPRRHEHFDHISGHDLVLTTYALLARDQEALLAHRYHQLILDEAQIIKNPRTKASRLVRRLSARHRFCLTGTPLENHLGELWSLFDFIVPGLLGDEKQFRRLCRNPIERQDDKEAGERLARRIRPFMLRRTKQEVAAELPPKSEIVRSVELEGGQRDLYESIRLAMHARVRLEVAKKGMLRSRIVILDALLKLRQVCCDPRLVKMEGAREVRRSAKLEMLLELLPEMIEEGRRILLFSQFTSMLALIEEALRDAAIPYVKLTGRTRDRATPVDRFQNREVPLFLISLKAGGLGLNLTAADTVIHYDPWWNPAVERQATDRAHRIGQDNPVFVYKFIIEGTVEEKIMAMQARKQALADSLFDRKGGAGLKWSERDLEVLFEPLEE